MTKEICLIILTFLTLTLTGSQAFAAKPLQTTQRIIVIDPGHGGDETGLINPSGLKEKEITLKLAVKVKDRLENRYNVHLTRGTDISIPVKERMASANELKADLFVSIHLHNAGRTYAFIYHFDLEKELYSHVENPESLWLFSPLKHKAESRLAAKSFSTAFTSPENNPDLKAKIFYGPIFPLEGATMPAVLIEPFSISALPSHPARLEILLENLSLLIAQGIDIYFKNPF